MPLMRPEDESDYLVVRGTGPVAQLYPAPPVPLPASLGASASWSSGVMTSDGYKAMACAITSSQAGTLGVQRYIDQAGLVALPPASSATLTAGTPATLTITDGLPFGSFQVTISNTGTASANLTGFALLLTAN